MEALRQGCPFCGALRVLESVTVREHHFGMGTAFEYLVCADCKSIYIADPGLDLEPYYGEAYYSYAGERNGVLGYIDRTSFRNAAKKYIGILRAGGATVTNVTRIVDVGSGSGRLLRGLRALGYRDVLGVDPYISPLADTRGETVLREPLESVARRLENARSAGVIMFHHSLEHVVDPVATLQTAAELLKAGGAILVRIPVANYAWQKYREYWWALDAPRHLAVPTENGMRRAAERAGFEVARVEYDSTAMQFSVSEAYARGDSLVHAFRGSPPRTLMRMFTSIPAEIAALRLNAQGQGDQAAFVLRLKH